MRPVLTIKERYILSLCCYLEQLSALPGLTDQSVSVPPQQEEQQHNDHEQPGEEEAETGAPATTTGVRRSEQRVKAAVQGCTHIMKKVPPQSAVQERSVGSEFGRRPRGPRSRPRRLHSTTKRTTQDTIRNIVHLDKHM